MAPSSEARQLGRLLKELRVGRGLTQAELASPHYSAAYVSQIESGIRNPTREALSRFSKVLEVDLEDLILGRNRDAELALQIEVQACKSLIYNGHASDALNVLASLERKARRLHNEVQADVAECRGLALEQLGRTQEALEAFQSAERLLAKEAPARRVGAVAGISRATQELGDARFGLHILETHLHDLNAQNPVDPTALMRVYSSLVRAYFAVGYPDRAIESAHEALRLSSEESISEELACMNINVARALLKEGKRADAIRALVRGEDIYASIGWSTEVALAKIAQGIVYCDKGAFDEARRVLTEALDGLGSGGRRATRAQALNELGRVERLAGDPGRGAALLDEAAALLRKGELGERAFNLRESGLCAIALGDDKRGRKLLEEAATTYRTANNPLEVAATLKDLGDVLSGAGDLQASIEVYREALDTVRERV